MISAERGTDTIVYLTGSPEVKRQTGGYNERNRKVLHSHLAQDEAVATKLWKRSAALVGASRPKIRCSRRA